MTQQTITEETLEQVLSEAVRPQLADHEGDVEIVSWDGSVLKVKLTGHCAGCPSASLTTEEIVKAGVQERLPQVKDVVLITGVSDGLIQEALDILRGRQRL